MDFFLYPKIKIAPPENFSAKILSSTKILLTWDSNPIASKYEVYLNGNLLHTLSSNSLNVEGLTPGEVSSYTIRAYDSEKNEYSNFSDKLDIQTYIPSTGYFDQIPTNSFELNEDTSSYLFNLYGNKISFNLPEKFIIDDTLKIVLFDINYQNIGDSNFYQLKEPLSQITYTINNFYIFIFRCQFI
mgnify:CR=1 FL=1